MPTCVVCTRSAVEQTPKSRRISFAGHLRTVFRCFDSAAELFFPEVGTLPLVYVSDGVIDRCKFLFGPYSGYPCFDGCLVCSLHLIERREVVLHWWCSNSRPCCRRIRRGLHERLISGPAANVLIVLKTCEAPTRD